MFYISSFVQHRLQLHGGILYGSSPNLAVHSGDRRREGA